MHVILLQLLLNELSGISTDLVIRLFRRKIAWGPIIIRDPQSTKARIAEVASNRYSYRQLDDFTDLLQRTLQRVPEVAKVQRVGVLPEEIYLELFRPARWRLMVCSWVRYFLLGSLLAFGMCLWCRFRCRTDTG